MTARTLMIQGTFSSAGKSLLVTALCRIFARRGLRVAPFKSQNMSNNAAVCADGAEIGRAQAVQAAAAGIAPTSDMNPILLKPEAGGRSQVLVNGRRWRTLPPRAYYEHKQELWPHITAAFDRLREAYDLVVIEGAGSPAELNLHGCDLANMAVARHARSPVLLAGDIDRGGVFAQLLGTLWLLPEEDRWLVRGLIVNKFRGDRSLFDDGVTILEQRGGVPVLGVVPFLPALAIPEEDSATLDEAGTGERPGAIDIAVIRLPHIANYDDFDPLVAEPDVQVRYIQTPAQLGTPDAVILPGTKSTIDDLAWLAREGLSGPIRRLAERNTAIVGICGGYQMLGRRIADPEQLESTEREIAGLALLDVETVFTGLKATYQAEARLSAGPGWFGSLAAQRVRGYEIHLGRSSGGQSWLEIVERNGQRVACSDGAASADGRIWGTYLHGLFANDEFRRAWLRSLGRRPLVRDHQLNAEARFRESLDRLADGVEAALDMRRLDHILEERCS